MTSHIKKKADLHMGTKIKLGISSCLLGEKVRYDGGHRWERFLTDTLGKFVQFVPVCPEVECGLGVPREAMRLQGDPAAPRLITVRTGLDHTARMTAWARRRVRELEAEGLCGFIFKSGSPSSGLQRVKVYDARGGLAKTGVGLFARTFLEHFPLLPVEDEGRLHDPGLRENFIEAIFVLKRWREVRAEKPGPGKLLDFHTRHKLLLLSHSPPHYREMGRLVAQTQELPLPDLYARYQAMLLLALGRKTTVKKNVNVLQHLLGFFKQQLSPEEKQEFLEVIENYRQEYVPLIVPITLINHYVHKYDQTYLKSQHYLNPHPLELKLRNHA